METHNAEFPDSTELAQRVITLRQEVSEELDKVITAARVGTVRERADRRKYFIEKMLSKMGYRTLPEDRSMTELAHDLRELQGSFDSMASQLNEESLQALTLIRPIAYAVANLVSRVSELEKTLCSKPSSTTTNTPPDAPNATNPSASSVPSTSTDPD